MRNILIAEVNVQTRHVWFYILMCTGVLCIPDGLSVVQCSLGHVIGVVFYDTILVT